MCHESGETFGQILSLVCLVGRGSEDEHPAGGYGGPCARGGIGCPSERCLWLDAQRKVPRRSMLFDSPSGRVPADECPAEWPRRSAPPATRFLGTGHGMFRRDSNWHRTPRSAPSSADRMSVSQPRRAVANPAPTAQSARAGKVQGTGSYSRGTMCFSSPCCRPLAAHTPHATRCWFWAAHPCSRRTRAWSGSAMDPSSQDERAGGEIGFREGRLGDESPAESSGHPYNGDLIHQIQASWFGSGPDMNGSL